LTEATLPFISAGVKELNVKAILHGSGCLPHRKENEGPKLFSITPTIILGEYDLPELLSRCTLGFEGDLKRIHDVALDLSKSAATSERRFEAE
jgi:hypothetical protein